jgi:hypothetical protein
MRRAFRIIALLALVAIVAVFALQTYRVRQARKAGILSETIDHQGNVWKADYTALIPAPEKAVFAAIEHIEDSHSPSIREVKVLSQDGNHKTVELQMAGLAGQSAATRLAFEYFPDQHRITYRSVDNPAFDTQAEYQLTDQGAKTLIAAHQTTRLNAPVPLPDELIKQGIRSIFVAQLEGIRRSLNITDADDEDADEP